MGFLGSKKTSKSVASKSIASHSNDGTTKSTDSANKKKLLKKGQKLFQKVVSSKSASAAAGEKAVSPKTPSNGVAAATKTPATTLLQDEPSAMANRYHSNYQHNQNQTTARANVSSKAVEFGADQGEDYDVTSKEVLEERERIRQELFGDDDEEGIEVTAQFRQPNAQQQQQQQQQQQPAAITARQQFPREEEKKEDDSPSSPQVKSYKNTNNNQEIDSLPSTPELDPAEADPVARFPAVQAAMAARSVVVPPSPEAQPKIATIDTAPSFPLLSTTSAAAMATTTNTHRTAQTATRTAATAHPVSPSPEKPFDEDLTRPKDPTILEMKHETEHSPSPEKPFDEVEPKEPEQEDFFQLAAKAATGCTSGATANVQDDTVTRKLLDVFNCGNNDFTEFSGSSQYTKTTNHRSCRLVDAFYDNTCYWTYSEATQMNRPYYDEQFAQRFLRVRILMLLLLLLLCLVFRLLFRFRFLKSIFTDTFVLSKDCELVVVFLLCIDVLLSGAIIFSFTLGHYG